MEGGGQLRKCSFCWPDDLLQLPVLKRLRLSGLERFLSLVSVFLPAKAEREAVRRGRNRGKIFLKAHISMKGLNSINGCISLLSGGFEEQRQKMTDQRKSQEVIG